MIELRSARGEELPAARALWTETFGDDGAFQRRFYARCGVSAPLVLAEDGEVRAMLALPERELVFPDGWKVRAGYVYALATRPDSRGRGHASRLLDLAGEVLRRRGADCMLTVPAEPSLFRFFAGCGFVPGFYHRILTVPPAAAPAAPLSPEEYAVLREARLAGSVHVRCPVGQLAFQREMCPRPGSGLYRLELAHGPGCAAVENWAEGPVAKELLCAPGDEAQGAAAVSALCGAPAEVRLPAGAEDGIPFGAVRWLFAAPPSRWQVRPEGWLGPAFD